MMFRVSANDRIPIICLSILLILLAGCSSSYPYIFLTDNCRCQTYTYRDVANKIEIEFKAVYKVDEKVSTTVEIVFRNHSRDTLSLQQAFIKGTSRNIRYQYNDKARPLPYVTVPPQQTYSVTLEGTDTEVVEDPWRKIAGERTVIEIKGLMLGEKVLSPVKVDFIPLNPKLSS